MAVPVYLQQFKAAGIYRVVFDKSTVEGVDTEILRLVVGYSEKGPFNVPTYVQSTSDFKSIYGDVSKKLEKRGIYFHRMAIQALSQGPILCLNLKKFSEETVDAYTISTDVTTVDKLPTSTTNVGEENYELVHLNVEDIFDTSRFWTLDANKLPGLKGKESGIMDNYINISATSEIGASNSFFIRKASGSKVSQFNVTVSDWYNDEHTDVPEYLQDKLNNKISDFFAEIYVFSGKFNADQVLASTTLKNYFETRKIGTTTITSGDGPKLFLKSVYTNAFGDAQDTLDALYNDSTSGALGHYVGCLIPNFKDKNGVYQSLDIVFNTDHDTHNMMLAFDTEGLEENDGTINIDLSGRNSITAEILTAITDSEDGETPSNTTAYASCLGNSYAPIAADILTFGNTATDEYADTKANPISITGSLVVTKITDNTTTKTTEFELTTLTKNEDNNNITLGNDTYTIIVTDEEKATLMSTLGINIVDGTEDNPVYYGDVYCTEFNSSEFKLTNKIITKISKITQQKVTSDSDYVATANNIKFNMASIEIITTNDYNPGTVEIDTDTSIYSSSLTFVEIPTEVATGLPSNEISTNDKRLISVLTESDCLLGQIETRGTRKGKYNSVYVQTINTSVDADGKVSYTIKFTDEVTVFTNGDKNYLVRIDNPLCQEIGYLTPMFVQGYEYINYKPANTSMKAKLDWQNLILSCLTDYKGIRTGLLNKSDIDYRYIIDTFESYVSADCKSVLSLLAKEKQSAFAILNFPSVQTFRKCPYTSFTDSKNVFNVKYVVDGYNKKKSASIRFSLPTEPDGASFCAFYTPLKFTDGYVDTIVPSAGLVSNLFIQKYVSRQPYYIIAGPNYGGIKASGLVGPDYNYSQDELQVIEPFGVNCMVYRPSFGTFINANQTAKQTPKSALSSVNVRELVIYLQDEIEKVLQAYQWEFNNATTRNAILDKANFICSNIQANGGIQAYLNVMDESNNTADIIDNEMAILSTHIEPGRGCGKMVQELTLYRTGGMSASISE